MLESIIIMMIAIGFISFVLAIESDSIIYSAISLLMWIIVMAGHVYIQVPGDTYYNEVAMFPLSFGMIMLNIIWLIIQFIVKRNRRRYIR
jgi:hypothetical protein